MNWKRSGTVGRESPVSPESSRTTQLGLYLRTIRHLQPAQIAWRVKLRVQQRLLTSPAKAGVRQLMGRGSSSVGSHWPEAFRPLDADRFSDSHFATDFFGGRITLLGSHAFLSDGWRHIEQPQLWRFHLHYWDWAWQLHASTSPEQFQALFAEHFRAWKTENPWGSGDAWAPYVVSLRTWTLCGLHRSFPESSEVRQMVAVEIREHADFLRWACEYDVGGNHLLKNLKGLVGAAVFLGDNTLLQRCQRAIARQIEIQVLADGGHFERSPAYHAQVLGDFIDIEHLLACAGVEQPAGIQDAIARMRSWLDAMAGPQRLTPAFNDGPCVGDDELRRLGVRGGSHEGLRWLAESGYVVVNPSERVHLVVDVGDPCPDELPAHAHADCLSFALSVDGRPAVVDTGTSEYGAGPRRAIERSTAAHNTVAVDGQDQTEVWGSFRAASRARPSVLAVEFAGDIAVVEAEHDGYRRLPGRPMHRRRIVVSPAGMAITDTVRGRGDHMSTSSLHMACSVDEVRTTAGRRVSAPGVDVVASADLAMTAETYASAFGEHLPCTRLQQQCAGLLPHQFSWDLTWPGGSLPTADTQEESDS